VGSPTPDPGSGPDHFLVDLTFAGANCAQQPEAGDVIELAGIFLEVTTQGLSPSGGVVEGLAVELIVGDSSTFFGGAALFRTPFEASADQPDCFVSFSPTPASFPGNGVAPTAEITVTFSEPMDPESIDPYDSLRIVRDNENDPLKQFIIGQITAGTELREFTFTPALPLHHDFNSSEIYNIEVVAGDNGPTDLAGNPLLDSLPLLNFSLDSQAPTSRNSGIVYRFADVDEDGDGFIDTNGQFVILPDREVIQGRPVSRFSNAVDNTNPVPSLMTPNTATTVTEPLAPLGSRLMSFWRLADMGMSLGQQDTETRLFESDSSLHNLDIERINWAPRGGQPLLENFPNFSMSLGTSTRLPDESHDPIFLTSFYGGSGLLTTGFEDNVLVDPESELRQVHDASQGYLVNPVESFGGVGNLQVMPYPMNTGSNPDLYEYFTWRDTSVQDVGGADGQGGSGADLGLGLAFYLAVIALPPPHPIPPPLYSGLPMHVESSADPALDPLDVAAIQAPDGINSIGLPLLMDFKCFPTGSTTLGINTFDTSLPYVQGCCVNGKASFRIHSTGGHNTAGTVISVDPALAQLPTGGFNPLSTPPGAPTPPGDDFFYSGQLDFVVRVSRAFTRFVDTSVSNFTLLDPIVLPLPQDQPTGTSISIDFRVAVDVFNSPNGNDLSVDASALDSYGDLPDEDDRALTPSDPEVITVAIAPKVAPQFKNDGVSFATPTGYQWMDDLDAINEFIGARYLQARLTFVSNPATGLAPEASSLAIPYLLP